jgi:SAM-dependent methyltransferase
MSDKQRESPSQNHARLAYDRMAQSQRRFATPVRDDELRNPLSVADGCGWLGDSIKGKHVLCLAAGGGRQSALYAAAGAAVTVVDISPEMLRLDREVATEHGLDVRTVEASMEDLSMLPEKGFDIVIQPVSTCYVPNVAEVYRQVARVTVAQGLYISQHKQPTSLQLADKSSTVGYMLDKTYYHRGPLPVSNVDSRVREAGTLEHLHRWEELIGRMCRAGFVIEDLLEPHHAQPDAALGTFGHRSQYVAPYVRIKARRIGTPQGRLITSR